MAEKYCKKCGLEITKKTRTCPRCGKHPYFTDDIPFGLLIFLCSIIIIPWISLSIASRNTPPAPKESSPQERVISTPSGTINTYQTANQTFLTNIENHYQDFLKCVENKEYDGALSKIEIFRRFGRLDYKDIKNQESSIKNKAELEKISKLKSSDIDENLKAYQALLEINPDNQKYKKKVEHYRKKHNESLEEQALEEYKRSCQLAILSSSWHIEYDFAIYEGQVKNISLIKLENVEALVTWYDKNGNMITSDSSLIAYNPILPGQSSPFKVMKTSNPAMKKASIEFKYLLGGKINSYSSK